METTKACHHSADSKSNFSMIDVGEKLITRRKCIASGKIRMLTSTLNRIQNKEMPKGDVLSMAEVAGICAAKNTSNLLPMCHPLLIDKAKISWEFLSDEKDPNYSFIKASSEVIVHAKTGVEMEALSSVTAALLSVYDLTKGVDPALSLSEIYLNYKEGGKSGQWHHPHFSEVKIKTENKSINYNGINCAVITISDRAYNKQKNYHDESGPFIQDFLKSSGANLNATSLVPDEVELIQKEILKLVKETNVDLIISTGGTGLCPRDVTPEALKPILEKEVPGITELLRSNGAKHTQNAYLSRGIAGIINKTLIISLPGSLKAVREGMDTLKNILPHAIGSIKEDAIHKNHGK